MYIFLKEEIFVIAQKIGNFAEEFFCDSCLKTNFVKDIFTVEDIFTISG